MLAIHKRSAALRSRSPHNLLSGNWARLLHRTTLFVTSLSVAGAAMVSAPNLARGQAPPPPAGEVVSGEVEGIETLTHGPIHEAFAAPTASDPAPGPVVPKQPPANIDEEPPSLKAEGAIWIGGYWEWDDELTDFIWVSGNWRVPPPGMRWVPSYWVEAEGGWQRVPGFWISADAGELEYRDTPPESLEVGPSGPAPADDYFWIPGTWNYYQTGFRWRAGYWSPYNTNWVWCPARWVWTPGGCVYIAGFWDERVPYRGSLFAPIRFRTALYLQPGFRYRPWCVVPTDHLFVHLWLRPRSHCYYFGNYYGPRYAGWIPWYRCGWGDYRRHYDPLVSWCRTHYRRQGIDYVDRMDGWHRHFADREDLRPPRTWREQVDLVARGNVDLRGSQRILGADLRDVARRDDLPLRLTEVSQRQREALAQVNDQHRDLRSQRLKIESEGRARVTARIPLDRRDADRPGHEAGIGAGIDAQARVRDDLKLRLPKLDAQATARIDAALGAGARAGSRARNLPATADPGPAGERTGRVDRPGTTGTERANEALRSLREKGILPDDSPRIPRTERSGVDAPRTITPRTETPRAETPRADTPRADRQPRADDVPERTPRSRPPFQTPPYIPENDLRIQPRTTPRTDSPRTDSPRTEIPRVNPRLKTPRADATPRRVPSGEIPRVTPRAEIPRRDVTPRTTPRSDLPRVTPRLDVPRSTPRVEMPRSTPRVEIPRGNRDRDRD